MKTIIALPIFLLACGGNVTAAPTPQPAPLPDSPDASTFAPSPEPVVIRDEPPVDLTGFVCTVPDDGGSRDVACDTSTHQFWSWCPESACISYVGCDQAIKKGLPHAGEPCITIPGELGIVNAR